MYENKSKKIIIGCIISSIILVALLAVIFIKVNSTKQVIYKVAFNSDGGTKISQQEVKNGSYVKRPTDPKKEGYQFIDWSYNDKTYDFKSKVTKNITLIARWFKLDDTKEMFTIKFNSDGGTTISNQVIEKGKNISKPIDPIKKGYVFKGWTLNGEIYDFTKVVESNLELTAIYDKINQTTKVVKKYEKQNNVNTKENKPQVTTTTKNATTKASVSKKNFMVTFNSNGGSTVASQSVLEGNKAIMPSNPTREGYNFSSWTLNGNNYNFNTPVSGNITLVAKWIMKNYVVRVFQIDQYSPDRILKVYEDGREISVSQIKYNNATLCSGSNMAVNMYEISGISSVTVVLKSGSSVTANVQQ